MITLTAEERRKFAEYCREQAESYAGIVKQVDLLPNGEVLAKPIKLRMTAFIVVGLYLEGTQEQTIG